MKAEVWQLEVCGSAIDVVHGNFSSIIEIYLPEKGIGCNVSGCTLHCFRVGKCRYGENTKAKKIGDIKIGGDIVKNILEYLQKRDDIFTEVESITRKYSKKQK